MIMKRKKKTFKEKAMTFLTITCFSIAILGAVDRLLNGTSISSSNR